MKKSRTKKRRTDLAKVVSKFIGETEKTLEAVFADAARSDSGLFFDEAEALFGKRSEVKDAHDCHAAGKTKAQARAKTAGRRG